MTNERARAPEPKLTRGEMQDEAMIIGSLLNAAMALSAVESPKEIFSIVEMAHSRAYQLNQALDSVNTVEIPA